MNPNSQAAALCQALTVLTGRAVPADTAKNDPGFLNLPKVAAAKVQPAMPRAEIEAGLKSHDRALSLKEGWIRDPYAALGLDEVQKF